MLFIFGFHYERAKTTLTLQIGIKSRILVVTILFFFFSIQHFSIINCNFLTETGSIIVICSMRINIRLAIKIRDSIHLGHFSASILASFIVLISQKLTSLEVDELGHFFVQNQIVEGACTFRRP